MAVKYQVFISSTYEDLIGARDQVIKAVLEMGHIPVGMEMFSAADEEQWKIIARHIDESDYYAVLIAHRYGSMSQGVSYTRKEYEYALSRGIPVLGFLLDETASWPNDKVDKGDEIKAHLDEFKALVKQKPVSFWNSEDDLYGRFSVALTKAITANPRDGWVRSSSVVGPEVTSELTRLSAENAHLRQQIEQTVRDSETQREAELAQLDEQLENVKRTFRFRYKTGDRGWITSDEVSHGVAFDILAPSLVVESSVREVAAYWALNLRASDETRVTDIVALNHIQDLFGDWLALDLVEPSSKKHSVNDNEEYWSLTQTGLELLKRNKRRHWSRRMNARESDSVIDDGTEQAAAQRTTARKATAKKATAKKA